MCTAEIAMSDICDIWIYSTHCRIDTHNVFITCINKCAQSQHSFNVAFEIFVTIIMRINRESGIISVMSLIILIITKRK